MPEIQAFTNWSVGQENCKSTRLRFWIVTENGNPLPHCDWTLATCPLSVKPLRLPLLNSVNAFHLRDSARGEELERAALPARDIGRSWTSRTLCWRGKFGPKISGSGGGWDLFYARVGESADTRGMYIGGNCAELSRRAPLRGPADGSEE